MLAKRFLSIAIVLILVLLCGCNGGGNSVSDKNSSNSNSPQNTTTPNVQTTQQVVDELFPVYKSARQIYVVDVTNYEKSLVLFLRQLQGVVAKYDSAAVYLVSNEQDRFWLNYMCDELGAYSTDVSAEEVVSLFNDYIDTLVFYTPGTFEFYAAWNDAVRRDKAVCVDYSVAAQFSLLDTKEFIDIRGVFASETQAYETLFEMIELDDEHHSFVSLNEDSAFIDYAIALDAYLLPVYDNEWSKEFTSNVLSKCELEHPGVFYTEYEAKEYINIFSENGFGNIAVAEFGNSTVFSSVKTTYVPDKIKVKNTSGKKGNVYISLLIESDSLGDAFNSSHSVCDLNREDYCVSVQYPIVLSRLAPATLLWYSLNTKQNDDSIVSDGDWSVINYDLMPDELYKKWHEINNNLLSACGMKVNVAGGYTESDLNNNYINFSKSDGVLFNNSLSQSGAYAKPKKIPVVYYSGVQNLSELEMLLKNIVADNTCPLYYVFTLTAEQYFEQIPIYDDYGGNQTDAFYSITEIIALTQSNLENVNFVVPEQMISYIKKG